IKQFDIQVSIATHSTSLLAALGQFGGTRTSVIYLDKVRNSFEARPFTSIQRELAACLGGHALMGPLFGAPLLLVEGDDDYRIWSQVPRHHNTNFSVIPSNGEEIHQYQKSLEAIFSALREPLDDRPAGYALLDGDKAKPQRSAERPQQHIRYIRLSCREAENLYLTDEVLQTIGIDWAAASPRIAEEAGRFGNKQEQLSSAPSWDRMNGDF